MHEWLPCSTPSVSTHSVQLENGPVQAGGEARSTLPYTAPSHPNAHALQFANDDDPAGLYGAGFPHWVHDVAPLLTVLYRPAGHGAHAAAPCVALNVPPGHGTGEEDPTGQNAPSTHSPLQEAFVDAPSPAPKVPAGHGVHASPPPRLYHPGGQGVQAVAPAGLLVPAGQRI